MVAPCDVFAVTPPPPTPSSKEEGALAARPIRNTNPVLERSAPSGLTAPEILFVAPTHWGGGFKAVKPKQKITPPCCLTLPKSRVVEPSGEPWRVWAAS